MNLDNNFQTPFKQDQYLGFEPPQGNGVEEDESTKEEDKEPLNKFALQLLGAVLTLLIYGSAVLLIVWLINLLCYFLFPGQIG